jgi:hypothetical protein
MSNATNTITVAIDAGHSSFKYALHTGLTVPKLMLMPSAITQVSPNENLRSKPLIEAEKLFAYGRDALEFNLSESCFPTDDTFIGSANFFRLIRAVFMNLRVNAPVNLCLAIPDGMLSERRASITNHILNNEIFNDGHDCKVRDIRIIGQGAATAVTPGLKLKPGRAAYVDVGHKTILITTRDSRSFYANQSGSLDFGGWELLKKIGDMQPTSQNQRSTLATNLLRANLQNTTEYYRGEKIEMTIATVSKTTWPHDARIRIANVVRSFGEISNIVLSGGCGKYLRDELQSLGEHLNIVELQEPRYAVLKGMLAFLNDKAKRK